MSTVDWTKPIEYVSISGKSYPARLIGVDNDQHIVTWSNTSQYIEAEKLEGRIRNVPKKRTWNNLYRRKCDRGLELGVRGPFDTEEEAIKRGESSLGVKCGSHVYLGPVHVEVPS